MDPCAWEVIVSPSTLSAKVLCECSGGQAMKSSGSAFSVSLISFHAIKGTWLGLFSVLAMLPASRSNRLTLSAAAIKSRSSMVGFRRPFS